MSESVTRARWVALVPCAGAGRRADGGGPKQYVPIAGRSVLAHTLAALAQVRRLAGTLVVVAADDQRCERELPAGEFWVARCGGATRAASVRNGLAVLRERHGVRPDDWVLVHDAARCLVRAAWVDRLIDACEGDAVGGLLALPVADTLKLAQGERVARTLDRTDAWCAQTPQMFRLGLLEAALAGASADATDEASAVEQSGLAPLLVPGEPENFKLTWPGDFALAERLLQTR